MAGVLVLVLSSASNAGPPAKAGEVGFGQPFTLKKGETRKIGPLSVTMKVHELPFQAGPGGLEQFPYTTYSLEWREGKQRTVMRDLSPSSPDASFSVFDRYTFTVKAGEADELTVSVLKRTCLLEYTTRNQLKHKDGTIIWDDALCCSYDNGVNTCDLDVARYNKTTHDKYCVLYSNQPLWAPREKKCCCQYEENERLDKNCEATCRTLVGARR